MARKGYTQSMSNVTQLHDEHHSPIVTHAADEVRGIMAAKRIPGYKLPEITGTATSRGYWQRRLNGDVPFDLADLSYLADAFSMSFQALLLKITDDSPDSPNPINAKKAPTRKSKGLAVGPAGFDPATSTVESRQFAIVADLDAYRKTKTAA